MKKNGMMLKILLLLDFVILSLAGKTANLDSEQVAEKCCGAKAAECCKKAIDFHNPIKCRELSLNQHVDAMLCVQREIHGVEDLKKLSVNDFNCCEIFAENDNDEENVCQHRCLRALQSPSLPASWKLDRINRCRMNLGDLPSLPASTVA
ncbi:hypothetical protein L596_027949 [Steinernema carpocapsae]|uniref:Domain of unknown function DB domain-containing protein n=2 Tax=Steinernema carpocapsae TaxID=34508 RepID=A0A4U5LX51_STECR|nr:hypothetical protein L596_027949 [Steinernema carpocapsae]